MQMNEQETISQQCTLIAYNQVEQRFERTHIEQTQRVKAGNIFLSQHGCYVNAVYSVLQHTVGKLTSYCMFCNKQVAIKVRKRVEISGNSSQVT